MVCEKVGFAETPVVLHRSRWKRRWKNRNGVAIVEFAVCVPLLFLLIIGSLEATSAISCGKLLRRAPMKAFERLPRLEARTRTGLEKPKRFFPPVVSIKRNIQFNPADPKTHPVAASLRSPFPLDSEQTVHLLVRSFPIEPSLLRPSWSRNSDLHQDATPFSILCFVPPLTRQHDDFAFAKDHRPPLRFKARRGAMMIWICMMIMAFMITVAFFCRCRLHAPRQVGIAKRVGCGSKSSGRSVSKNTGH